MVRLWTILGVSDVARSTAWYQELLGVPRRARRRAATLEEAPRLNPSTGTRESALRDPYGYYVTVSAEDAPQ